VVDPTTAAALVAVPASRAVGPGGEAVYAVGVGNGFSGTVTLTATSPSPDLTLGLTPPENQRASETSMVLRWPGISGR